MAQASKTDVVNIQKSNELPENTTFVLPDIKSPKSNTNLNEIQGKKYIPVQKESQESKDM